MSPRSAMIGPAADLCHDAGFQRQRQQANARFLQPARQSGGGGEFVIESSGFWCSSRR